MRPWPLAVAVALAVFPATPAAGERAKNASKIKPAPPRANEETVREPEALDQKALLLAGGLGAGYMPGGSMVLVGVTAAYRWPWEDWFIEMHGDYVGALVGTDLSHLLLLGGRVGSQLGTTGLTGWFGLGYRGVSLAMPFAEAHTYQAAALEGAIGGNISPNCRAEVGAELDFPASGPSGADLVIGAGAHGQVAYHLHDIVLFARYDVLDFHARFMASASDDQIHALSLGVRTTLW